MYSLCYLPTAGRMTLTVIKCRNLKAMDITGSSGNPVIDKADIKNRLAHELNLAKTRQQVKCGRRRQDSDVLADLSTAKPSISGISADLSLIRYVKTVNLCPRSICEGLPDM